MYVGFNEHKMTNITLKKKKTHVFIFFWLTNISKLRFFILFSPDNSFSAQEFCFSC